MSAVTWKDMLEKKQYFKDTTELQKAQITKLLGANRREKGENVDV